MSGYLPLACYGKLPCDEEYLESGLSFAASRALQAWIIEGREEALVTQEEMELASVEERLGHRFVFSPPGAAELVAGVIRPSQDRKPRRFPFVTLAHVAKRSYAGRFDLLAMALAPVWDALDDAWDALAGAPTVSAFWERVESASIPVPLPAGEAEELLKGGWRESTERLFGPAARGELSRLEESMPAVIQRIRQSSSGDSAVLRLPLSGDQSRAPLETAFWIALFNKQFFWRRIEPSIFLGPSTNGGGPSCHLFIRSPTPRHYRWLTGIDPNLSGVLDPAGGGPSARGGQVSGPFPSFHEVIQRKMRG